MVKEIKLQFALCRFLETQIRINQCSNVRKDIGGNFDT